ncbi:MAG: hypothetical protein ACK5O7_02410 [Holosporales bacterium]
MGLGKTQIMKYIKFAIAAVLLGCVSAFASEPQRSLYELPDDFSQEALFRSSVIVRVNEIRLMGVAVGERHILTCAHALVDHTLHNDPVHCYALTNQASRYDFPLASSTNAEGEDFHIDYAATDFLREIPIHRVEYHPDTSFKKDTTQILTSPVVLMEEYPQVLAAGIESNEFFCGEGIFCAQKDEKKGIYRVHGPDLALLECAEPHGLPILGLADPLDDERPVLHVPSFWRLRLKSVQENVRDYLLRQKFFMGIEPKVIGQRFRCLPANKKGLKSWSNRVFLPKKQNGTFDLDFGREYPGAPAGFGVLAAGDSGAAAVTIKQGRAYLVGIVSHGEIDRVFRHIHRIVTEYQHILPQLETNMPLQTLYANDRECQAAAPMIRLYREAFRTQDPQKKWFMTQGLSDVTQFKAWITSKIAAEGSPSNPNEKPS